MLTVPASFDEEARELTVEAARQAQFAHLTLIEEPIAAFYAWIAEHHTRRSNRTRSASLSGDGPLPDDGIALVCDVGGGTTDFSLIRVSVEAGAHTFERISIGDHLLLGGDNVDLALAARVERRIAEARPEVRLAITQRAALRRMCSAAKERLLGDAPPDRVPITVLGAGRSVIGDRDHHRSHAGRRPVDARRIPADHGARRDRDRQGSAGRSARARIAVRDRPGDHPPPGRVSGAGGRRRRRTLPSGTRTEVATETGRRSSRPSRQWRGAG